MAKFEDVPEELRLNYYTGEIVISDSFAEHEARVLWSTLREVDLMTGTRPEMFGRLLPNLQEAFEQQQVPVELRDIAVPLIEMTRRWHRYRRDMVHDLLTMGWGRNDDVHSALGKHPPRPMMEIVECAKGLRNAGYRLRGLYIIAPYWLGGVVDSWADAPGLRSWTRVAMGHLADVPNTILGTEGPAPEPPGGWEKIVADELAKREAEAASFSAFRVLVEDEDDELPV